MPARAKGWRKRITFKHRVNFGYHGFNCQRQRLRIQIGPANHPGVAARRALCAGVFKRMGDHGPGGLPVD